MSSETRMVWRKRSGCEEDNMRTTTLGQMLKWIFSILSVEIENYEISQRVNFICIIWCWMARVHLKCERMLQITKHNEMHATAQAIIIDIDDDIFRSCFWFSECFCPHCWMGIRLLALAFAFVSSGNADAFSKWIYIDIVLIEIGWHETCQRRNNIIDI